MNDLISKEISCRDTLSQEENNALAVLAQNGDKEAIEKLVLSNLRLVVKQVNKYKHSNDEDDLFQNGVYGILRAILTYDPDKSSFSTHVTFWIRSMILKSFRDTEMIHYDSVFYNKCIRYKNLCTYTGGEQTSYSDQDLENFNLTENDISLIRKFLRQTLSLEAVLEGTDDENSSYDKIAANEDSVEAQISEKEMQSLVFQEMKRLLSEQELFVIQHTYGIHADKNKMTTVAKMFSSKFGKNYTRQGIREIRVKAENKLRKSKVLQDLFF